MPLPKDDRIAFSLQIVGADAQIKGLLTAKSQLQTELEKLQKLDTANKNLFDPVNALVTAYQSEYTMLDGNVRTVLTEQDIQDSGNKKIRNVFFPNDVNTPVPSLASTSNIWTKIKPFALGYGIGKNYSEAYGTTTKESDLINAVLALITSAGGFTDMNNTTGQECGATGSCSNPMYTTQASCTLNGGTWTPGPDAITTYAAVHTLKNNLVTAVNNLKTFLLNEAAVIVTNDPDSANQANNNAAINNINNVIIPALNTWLGYVDFNTAHGQTTCVGFNSYNSNLLAPTKLHSTQLAALQTAVNNRLTFQTTRLSQLQTVLGTISQDLNTGELISSSGLYGKRYGFVVLRLNALGGSLSQLIGLQTSSSAQDSIISNIKSTKATYLGILPTSLLKAPGNGSSTITVVDPSFLNPGDTVFITAENQEELQRAVKSVTGDLVVLNDVIPAKFRPAEKARIYKDLT